MVYGVAMDNKDKTVFCLGSDANPPSCVGPAILDIRLGLALLG